MNKVCEGCGAILQDQNVNELGYTNKLSNLLCQRCYRIVHYDDLTLDLKELIKPEVVLQEIEKIPGLILWVVDLWDISGSLKLPIQRYLYNRDILLVATKRDLLPTTLSNGKLSNFLLQQLKENNIKVKGIVVLANHAKDGIDKLLEVIATISTDKNVILVGNANSGKSTLLKELTQKAITVSKYPGTTAAISCYQKDNLNIYDTPGLINNGSVLQYIDKDDLKMVIPKKITKIKNFQIVEDQSFAIGGLVRIDLIKVKKATIIFYIAETINIHRGKVLSAADFWQRHYRQLLSPTIGELSNFRKHNFAKYALKVDICINGLGFVSIVGEVQDIAVYACKDIDITIRKGMV